ASVKCIAHTRNWKRRGVWHLLCERITCEFFDGFAIIIRFKESIMLLSRSSRQRLKPMGVMCRSITNSPCFHRLCNLVGELSRKFCAFFNNLKELFVRTFREVIFHLRNSKYVLSIDTSCLNRFYFFYIFHSPRYCYL